MSGAKGERARQKCGLVGRVAAHNRYGLHVQRHNLARHSGLPSRTLENIVGIGRSLILAAAGNTLEANVQRIPTPWAQRQWRAVPPEVHLLHGIREAEQNRWHLKEKRSKR